MHQSACGPFQRGHPFGRFFEKIFVGPPFALFQKMRVLGDLTEIAITWPFGHFWSRCFNQNLLQSLHFQCILFRGYCHLRQSPFGPFKRGLLLRRFLKNFLWSPLCTFLENAGICSLCENCHNLVIRALLEPLFSPKSSPVVTL